jgi:hypothetical protein
MCRRAVSARGGGAGMAAQRLWKSASLPVIATALAALAGCSHDGGSEVVRLEPPRLLVVAPVLNLSGSEDFDPLKLTDLIASEFLSFRGVAVVPVNLTLAELERRGKQQVETPEDAVETARALGADATIVTAVTEYDPYSPPVVGLVMQWYDARPGRRVSAFDPVSASRASGSLPVELSEAGGAQPRWQIQRVFNAADREVLHQIREFAERRDGDHSPYGWRKHVRSQEHYVRYCGWSMIRTILLLETGYREANVPNEAEP